MRLKNKTAIITGGGSGIGRATSLLFAREGAKVLIVDIDGEKARQVAREISREGGVSEDLQGDVSSEEGAERIVSRTVSLWQRLDILVNNAASFHRKQVDKATREDWEIVWRVNVLGTSFCTKYAVEVMKKQNEGVVVNIASINGLIGAPDFMTYNATKAAIINMTKSMAVDLAPHHIRVNCICPGMIHTPALDSVLNELGLSLEEAEKIYLGRAPIKRFGKPEEISPAILFVASEEAFYMTGAIVVVDGGYTA